MKNFILSLIALILNLSLIFAQTVDNKKCGSDIVHKWRLEHEVGYAESYEKLKNYVADFVAKHPNGYSPKSIITIPVVFHVVLSPTEHSSFLDLRCIENIGTLNTDYSGTNTHSMSDFPASLKANCDIQFCLATIDTSGAATSGIERRDYIGPDWATGDNGVKQTATGGFDAWDPTKYLNIWVCNLEYGMLGYATYPTVLDNFYGLVIDYTATGTTGALPPYDLGGTASHEIGHCLYLSHIWGDSPGCTNDDGFSDTPIQDIASYGAPTGVIFDDCQTTSPGIMYMNFMDYSDDIAYANFTPDQKLAMQALFAPGGVLEPLTTSDKCGIPQSNDNVFADFQATTARLIVQGQTVGFQDNSTGNISSWYWTFQSGSPASSTFQNPLNIIYNTPGIYDVCLIVSNGIYSDTLCKQGYIVVTTQPWPDPNGYCDTISNNLPTEFPLTFVNLLPSNWGYLPGHNGLHIKAYADKYVNYTFNVISQLIVPVSKAWASLPSSTIRFKIWSGSSFPQTELGFKDINISNMTPYMYYPVLFDSPIQVNGTFFCGFELTYSTPQDTFTCYMVNDRGALGLNTLFVKDSNNTWRTCDDVFGIHTSLGTMVAGCLSNNLVNIEQNVTNNKVAVYPLPSTGLLNIDFSEITLDNDVEMRVFDLLGNELKIPKSKTSENLFKIDFSLQTSGIYFIIIRYKTQLYKTKVSVIH